MADKSDRTEEVFRLYKTYLKHMDPALKPFVAKDNESEIFFSKIESMINCETAQDPNAGRSTSRMSAHLSEFAFYPYPYEIDEGVQNSIPLAKGTIIWKESTANGMAGDGFAFYDLWQAAERGDTIYKPFFVAWYEIDDYALTVPSGFILNKTEIDLVKKCPLITNANLVWRRLKLSEYANRPDSTLSPEDRFCQDFPSWPEQAFLSTGRPVFDQLKLKAKAQELRENRPARVEVTLKKKYLSMYPQMLTIFFAPKKGETYVIGGDVAEGVSMGDFSHAYIMDSRGVQCGYFHGHIDADHFGRILVELAKAYNEAVIVPEINNMGHTTLNAIKQEGYLKVFMRTVYDEISNQNTEKMGWRTTAQTKQHMINTLIQAFRDDELAILDPSLLNEMMSLIREDNGDIKLTGKDRVVACCLALQGLTQLWGEPVIEGAGKKKDVFYEKKDLSRDEIEKKIAVIY